MSLLPVSPHEFNWLSGPIGDEAFFLLIEKRGGTRLKVPLRAEGSALAQDIGEVAAAALCAALGGNIIKVPLAKEWRVRCYRAHGLSYSEISRKIGCTETTIWRLLNNAGQTKNQLSLFD